MVAPKIFNIRLILLLVFFCLREMLGLAYERIDLGSKK